MFPDFGLRATIKSHLRTLLRYDEGLITSYMRQPGPHGMHIGCGTNVLPSWLNCDLTPKHRSVIRLDATKTYPVAESSIDYVFTEHFIEHITYPQGLSMLKECHRVLKPGGKIRITTPDLAFLIALYNGSKTEQQQRYLEWATKEFIPYAPSVRDAFVINNFFTCDWGHQFIYDRTSLPELMRTAGFNNITSWEINKSDDPNLRNLENEERMPAGFLQLESMTFEGTK
jgi:predicted SAM-dependent methyltransferase